jgi:hypothetical protein
MPKTCPPGVFCIEKFTLLIVILIVIGLYFIINNITFSVFLNKERKSSHIHTNNLTHDLNVNLSNQQTDFENPYNPPMKENQYLVPINIKTQSRQYNNKYSQIGILTRLINNDQILPLFGRPLIANRDKWNFYTMNDKTNMIKLPIIYKNKRSTSEYGCDNLYTGDIVRVEGYDDDFKVTIYDNENLNYLAY